jgi:hypothetical protein
MSATTISSTMSTSTTQDRVPETVYSHVYDSLSEWPEPEASLARKYFDENKERLLNAEQACFFELHTLLNVPVWFIPFPRNISAGGRFISEMQPFEDHFSEVVAEREYQQKCASYRALLEKGEWVKWMDALQAAREAVRIVDERGFIMTDQHAHLLLLDTVWAEWRKAK